MLKKVILSMILLSSLALGNDKDNDLIEIDYKEGVKIQERKYYENGAIQSIIRYADEEPFMEEKFFEDGTLYEKIFYKEGKGYIVFQKDEYGEEFYSPERRTKTVKNANGNTYKQDIKRDTLAKDTKIFSIEYFHGDLTLEKEDYRKVLKYGVFSESDSYGYDKEWKRTRKEISYTKDGFLEINENGNTTKYFPNGNKYFESIVYFDKQGKKHFEERYYDESEKLLSEEIEISNEVIKNDIDKRQKYFDMIRDDKPYKIFYSNGKLAYEKYFKDNKKIEKYFAKNGILTYEKEDYQQKYEINSEKILNDPVKYYKGDTRKLENIKIYTPEGKPIYIEKFTEDNKQIIFQITSYYPNGKIYYNEIEIAEKKLTENEKIKYELKRYGENGKLKYSLLAEKDSGNEKIYDDKGNLYYEKINTVDYKKREEIETEISYYKNGKARQETVTIWGEANGDLTSKYTIKTYSINGDLKDEYKKNY